MINVITTASGSVYRFNERTRTYTRNGGPALPYEEILFNGDNTIHILCLRPCGSVRSIHTTAVKERQVVGRDAA